MIEAVDVAVGDTVRVVLEGKAAKVFAGGFAIGAIDGLAAGGNTIFPAEQHVISVEKLAKPLAVGDVLTKEQYNTHDWEQHSVLLDCDEVDVLLLAADDSGEVNWVSSASASVFSIRELGRYISNVKILHLPATTQPAATVKGAK